MAIIPSEFKSEGKNLSIVNAHIIGEFSAKCILSVPSFTANLYCIYLDIDVRYTLADAVQICGDFWNTQYKCYKCLLYRTGEVAAGPVRTSYLPPPEQPRYCMSKKSQPILGSELLYKLGLDFIPFIFDKLKLPRQSKPEMPNGY